MNDPVPPPASEELKPRVQRILVPTDFSLPAERAIAYAVRLAEKTGAELYVVHVAEPLQAPPGCSGKEYLQMREHAERRVKEELTALVRRYASPEYALSLHPIALEGTPSQEILRTAVERDADIVVIATSGRNGFFKRAFWGSTVDKVVRYAACPVLVVREKEREIPPVL